MCAGRKRIKQLVDIYPGSRYCVNRFSDGHVLAVWMLQMLNQLQHDLKLGRSPAIRVFCENMAQQLPKMVALLKQNPVHSLGLG